MIHKTLLVEGKIRENEEKSDSTIDIIIGNNEIDSTTVTNGANHYIPILVMMENSEDQ